MWVKIKSVTVGYWYQLNEIYEISDNYKDDLDRLSKSCIC